MGERICPNCGEQGLEARVRFCPICGTALPEEKPPAEQAPALEEALRARYSDYNAWVVLTRDKEGAGRRFLELLSGNSAFKSSEKHELFFRDVGQQVTALLAAYKAAPDSGDLPALLHYTLIDCHRSADRETDWLFLVAEQHYLPLLELLSQQAAAALYADYKVLRKKQRGFPFQTQILKTLKRRGGL